MNYREDATKGFCDIRFLLMVSSQGNEASNIVDALRLCYRVLDHLNKSGFEATPGIVRSYINLMHYLIQHIGITGMEDVDERNRNMHINNAMKLTKDQKFCMCAGVVYLAHVFERNKITSMVINLTCPENDKRAKGKKMSHPVF